MDPDNTPSNQDDEALAFEAAFASEDGPPSEPAQEPTAAPSAAPATAPAAPVAAAPTAQGEPGAAESGEDDELAKLPPRVRAMVEQMERALPALNQVSDLAQRARKLEGRLGDLSQRIPTPAPTAPPRPQLPRVEAIRRDLPEVAEALDELLEHARASAPTPAPAPAAASPSSNEGAESDPPTTLLDTEVPDWREVAKHGSPFDKWLDSQGQQYAARIRSTDSEPVLMAAIARYKGEQAAAARAAQAAAAQANRVNQQRQARTAGAVVPTTPGRRTPATPTDIEDAAFLQGFNS